MNSASSQSTGDANPPRQAEVDSTIPHDLTHPIPEIVEPAPQIGEDVPPPAYGSSYGHIENDQEEFGTKADIADDGRVNIRINQKSKGLSSLLVPALRSQLNLLSYPTPDATPSEAAAPETKPPPINIVIQIVGSRGDVQPFVALGKVLKEEHGHRVRLATHKVFESLVVDNGLEFFGIGGDPSELMAFMVKNPGLMPGIDALRTGDVGKRRSEIATMIKGCWRSCIEAGDGSGVEASDKNIEDWTKVDGSSSDTNPMAPFIADAIIANPPSFAHIHCAERLGIPLHIMFTMPWSPTQAFPHPLANIQSSNADANITNYLSYSLVDMMTWQGLGDIINNFRQKSLGLEPISMVWVPGMLARMKIPHTYCWSPSLIPKPRDWSPHISICGFNFLTLGSDFKPDADLGQFLENGPPPVYIGFGSIVVDDPNAMTKMIFEAVKMTGQRALVSKGWGGLGADQVGIPEGVFMLGNIPHDWLFERVSCVVHHGGAGTTAAGIKAGKPTVIVPFFGDQAFWGSMVAKAGAGPEPIAYKTLTAEKLAASIETALLPASREKAESLAAKMAHETGTRTGAASFHRGLEVDKLRCVLAPQRTAVWRLKRTQIRLSAFAVAVLANEGLLELSQLKLYRPHEYETDTGPWDPVTGGASALIGITTSLTMGVADLPVQTLKALKIYPDPTRSRSASAGSSSPRSSSKPESPKPQAANDEKSTALSSSSEALLAGPKIALEDPPNWGELQQSSTSSSTKKSPSDLDPLGKPTTPLNDDQTTEADDKNVTTLTTTRPPVSTNPSERRPETSNQFDIEAAIGTGRGVSRIVTEGLKSPLHFTLSLAQGFHNAPKLYGDETVRKQDKITGFSSGIKAASKGFGYGMYDGITGLVTQPLAGAKKEGAAGFFKGMGKGIAGIVLKPQAGAFGVAGYTLKGLYVELIKKYGPSVDNYIIASRTAMGLEDVQKSTLAERQAVIDHWRDLRRYLKKNKHPGEEAYFALKEKVNESRSNGNKMAEWPSVPDSRTLRQVPTFDSIDTGIYSIEESNVANQETRSNDIKSTEDSETDFEEAIRRSITETSRGDPEEDAVIERAIRASIAEIEAARSRGATEAQLTRVMQEKIDAANLGLKDTHEISVLTPADFRSQLDEDADSGIGTQDGNEEADELGLALAESKKSHEEREADILKAKQEEEIVMRYIMKQSLAEEEMRRKKDGN